VQAATTAVGQRRTPGSCDASRVLSQMRDSRGGPNLAVRALAIVVALLLAGPLTLFLLRMLSTIVDLVV
jgi:hypothetical protein